MARGRKTKTTATQLKCTECGNIQTIHRRRGKQKKKNHVKHMYCYSEDCKETTAHLEVKDDPFLPEWLKPPD